MKRENIINLMIKKLKFAATSSAATAVDYLLYLLLVYIIIKTPYLSNIVSYSVAVLVNFYLQRRFIFDLKRKVHHAFMWSMFFSFLGLLLSTTLIYVLSLNPFLCVHQYITKFIVTGILFFYNFYTKQFAFEKSG